MMSSVYQFLVKDSKGADVGLSAYKGKVLLIVNVASRCGYTPQYRGLQELRQRYHQRGFEVLGFPCNQFGRQEPGTDEEVQCFAKDKYQAEFPVFAKVDVNGDREIPLYTFLKAALPPAKVKWNFTKFLVDAEGRPIQRYESNVDPSAIAADIERLLPPVSAL